MGSGPRRLITGLPGPAWVKPFLFRRHRFPLTGLGPGVRLILHGSGIHPSLPDAEVEATFAASALTWVETKRYGRVRLGACNHEAGRLAHALPPALRRLALTREVDRFLFEARREPEALLQTGRDHPLPSDAEGAAPRFVVRAEYTEPGLQESGMGRVETQRVLGQALGATAQVDLHDPEIRVRAWIARDRVVVGLQMWKHDAAGYQDRAPKNRPYFSPVSGQPALMRAVVNLARVPAGGLVYDPLSGTGGILLEGALAGLQVAGSDNDPGMVQGTRENLQRHGIEPAALFLADVREAPQRFLLVTGRAHPDAVVTDLPYGQSSPTRGAEPVEVAHWTLASAARLLPPGHRLVIGTPDPDWLAPAPGLGFSEEKHFDVRVHKSLTRSYYVLRRSQ